MTIDLASVENNLMLNTTPRREIAMTDSSNIRQNDINNDNDDINNDSDKLHNDNETVCMILRYLKGECRCSHDRGRSIHFSNNFHF